MAIEMINDVPINETFREFKYPRNYITGVSACYPKNAWELVYDFMNDQGDVFNQFEVKTIRIWTTQGYYPKEYKSYDGIFSYAEVEYLNKSGVKDTVNASFFGETSETDALRWAREQF
jgi:hypothetical protein